ncbi:GGDEF domain-containing protein [Streptomyces sp. McG3]|nr:GGDEF domain-containing protein [Streptomyces sp. McG3]
MNAKRLPGRIGKRTLLITTAVPLTGWAVHAVTLHKRLAATRRDPLTGLLRRDAYTTRARRLLARHGDDVALVIVDADHFKAVNDTLGHAAGDAVLRRVRHPPHRVGRPECVRRPPRGDEFAVVLELTADRREQRKGGLNSYGRGRVSGWRRPRGRPRRPRVPDRRPGRASPARCPTAPRGPRRRGCGSADRCVPACPCARRIRRAPPGRGPG